MLSFACGGAIYTLSLALTMVSGLEKVAYHVNSWGVFDQ